MALWVRGSRGVSSVVEVPARLIPSILTTSCVRLSSASTRSRTAVEGASDSAESASEVVVSLEVVVEAILSSLDSESVRREVAGTSNNKKF
jgi:hypothetical protein